MGLTYNRYGMSDYDNIKYICQKTNTTLMQLLNDIKKCPANSIEMAKDDFNIAIGECQSCSRIFFTSNLNDDERKDILNDIANIQIKMYELKCMIDINIKTTIVISNN